MPQKRANPRHFPLIYAAALKLGVDRATLNRALRGQFPNPALIAGYRKFCLAYIDSITLPLGVDATSAR